MSTAAPQHLACLWVLHYNHWNFLPLKEMEHVQQCINTAHQRSPNENIDFILSFKTKRGFVSYTFSLWQASSLYLRDVPIISLRCYYTFSFDYCFPTKSAQKHTNRLAEEISKQFGSNARWYIALICSQFMTIEKGKLARHFAWICWWMNWHFCR